MLQEVRSEVESTEVTCFFSCANETAAHNDVMATIETRSGKVFVQRMDFKAWKSAEVIDSPFPCIAEYVIEAFLVRRQLIDRALRSIFQIVVVLRLRMSINNK